MKEKIHRGVFLDELKKLFMIRLYPFPINFWRNLESILSAQVIVNINYLNIRTYFFNIFLKSFNIKITKNSQDKVT